MIRLRRLNRPDVFSERAKSESVKPLVLRSMFFSAISVPYADARKNKRIEQTY